MFVYIEYISRSPGVSLQAFRQVVATLQERWEGAHEGDVLLLNIARTWRVGPEPEYMTIWYKADSGLERLDEWEHLYTVQGEYEPWNEPFRIAGSMDAAGCYEPVLEPVVARGGHYYGEFLDVAPDASRDDVRDFFLERSDQHPGIELILLVDRIGSLGPDPRTLAFWSAPSWASLDRLVRELDGVSEPVRLTSGALYADLGKEIR